MVLHVMKKVLVVLLVRLVMLAPFHLLVIALVWKMLPSQAVDPDAGCDQTTFLQTGGVKAFYLQRSTITRGSNVF